MAWMKVSAAALLVLGALTTGCKKNEAATSACSAMADSESCSTCCTQHGASGYKYVGSGTCGCLGGGDKAVGPTTPASTSAPATAVSFAGTYKSTWGPTTFTQTGDDVHAKYPNGNMKCKASGPSLDCTWSEGSTFGKAKLVKQADGSIRGTWGNGGSATNGGPWTFLP